MYSVLTFNVKFSFKEYVVVAYLLLIFIINKQILKFKL